MTYKVVEVEVEVEVRVVVRVVIRVVVRVVVWVEVNTEGEGEDEVQNKFRGLSQIQPSLPIALAVQVETCALGHGKP